MDESEKIGSKGKFAMIDVKTAVKSAVSKLRELYNETETPNLLLEEVALSDDETYWNVTLGFSTPVVEPPNPFTNALSAALSKKFERKYKLFEIDAENGDFKAMRIRNV